MAKDPADRYADADQLRTALAAAAELPGADAPLPADAAVQDPAIHPHTLVRPAGSRPATPTPSSFPPSFPPPSYSPSGPSLPPSGPSRRRGRAVVVGAVVAVLVIAGGITAFALGRGGDSPGPGTADPTSGTTGDPTGDPSGDPGGATPVADRLVTGDLDGDRIGDLSVDYDPRDGTSLLTTTWSSDKKTFVDPRTSDLGPRTGDPTWRVRGYLDADETEDVLTFHQPGGKGPVSVSSTLSGGGTVDGELAGSEGASSNDALADVDGDGIDEILHLEVAGQRQVVLTTRALDGTTFGPAQEQFTFTDDIDSFAIWPGDFNGDGYADVATLVLGDYDDGGYPGTVEIRLGDGTGKLGEASSAPFTSTGSDLRLRSGNFDDDAGDELLVADRDSTFVVLNLFDLDGTTILPRGNAGSIRYVSTAPNDVAVIDVDGDGLDDVVSLGLTRTGGTGKVLVGRSNGQTFTSSVWLAWDQLFAAENNADDERFETLEDARW